VLHPVHNEVVLRVFQGSSMSRGDLA
jgi:hypothetical protein